MKKPALTLCIYLLAGSLMAQLGGRQSFEFLNLPVGARVAGLGGVIISATDEDVNLFLSNPSLLDTANHNFVSWSHLGFYADVKYNNFAYARNFGKLGIFGIGIQHLGYGDIDRYDAVGNPIGSFNAGETAVTISKSHQLGPFRMGTNLKYINSNLDTYSASALAMDIGGSYFHPIHELTVSILFKNLGIVLTDYSSTSSSTLPTDIQVGATFKPKDMPFRLSVTAYNLGKSESTFYDPSIDGSDEEPGAADKIFRHLNFGLEIVMNKNINIRGGYNHLIRNELGIEEKKGLSGVSLGFMARIKAFELSYTFSTYHVDSGRSYFTITSNLNRVFKKKSII
ncbi:MAG: type IX secretion system protein PorQ [Reichenbachiella sp.]